jgi:hypothetical protein
MGLLGTLDRMKICEDNNQPREFHLGITNLHNPKKTRKS